MEDLADMWKKIFSFSKSVKDSDKPLTPDILANPENDIVKRLIYIYSMESFIFSEMNRASRLKDGSKIKFYGAFASALGFIIHCGNKGNTCLEKEFSVYRGLQLDEEELKSKYLVGAIINLPGFTSTTLD